MVARNDDRIDELNDLLRGEISAAETYRMAIERISEKPEDAAFANELRSMQEDHGRAADLLRSRIQSLGGVPENDSGAWGSWAKTVQGAANIFGDTSAIKALRQGEEHGLKDMNDALEEGQLDPESAVLIRDQIAPTCRRHLEQLDSITRTVT